jgi:signal transduction histidine kinase
VSAEFTTLVQTSSVLSRVFILLFFGFPVFIQGQSYTPERARQIDDSLQLILRRQAKPDTNRINTLLALTENNLRGQTPGGIIPYAEEAWRIAGKMGHLQKKCITSLIMSRALFATSDHKKAKLYADTTLQLAILDGDKNIEGRAYYMAGINYFFMQLYAQATNSLYSALAIAEQGKDSSIIANCYGVIGACFIKQNKWRDAIEYALRGLAMDRKSGPTEKIANDLNAISEIYIQTNMLDSALMYNYDAESMNNSLGKNAPGWQAGYIWGVRGPIYERKGDIAKAEKKQDAADSNYRAALKLYLLHLSEIERLDSLKQFSLAPLMVGTVSLSVGRAYFKLKTFTKARHYTERGVQVCLDKEVIEELATGYEILASLDSADGDFNTAFRHYKLSRQYHDSIFNTENSRLVEQYKNQNDFEKKEKDLQLQITEEKLKSSLAQKRKQQMVFAWTIAFLILSGSAFAFIRFRRLHSIKTEQKQLRDRLAISQDLHDHVGSTLSSISVYSKVAQLQGEEDKKAEMNEVLGRIRSTSNSMITEMNDIVWAINPVNDTMEKIIRRMENYARPLLDARNIRFNFQYNEALFNTPIDMEKRKNFYLIFKEAINNAVKYSASTEVKAELYREGGSLVLKVNDNGIGFNPNIANSNSLSGNGLRNMRQRSKNINGELKMESSPGNGTFIILTCPA